MPLSIKSLSFEKSYLYLAIVFAFVLPISRAAVSLFIILFPLVWLIEGNYRHKLEQLRSSKALLVIALFILFQFITIAWSTDTHLALESARMYTYWFAIFVLATSIKNEWIDKIITAFLYGMVISEIFAYLIFFDIYAIKGQPPSYPSPFMMHIDYSVFLAFTSILLLNRIFSKRYSVNEKIVMFIFFATVTTNLFISTGRSGQLAFLVALMVSVIIHFRFSVKSILVFGIVSSTLLIGAYKTLPLFEKRINAAKSDIQKFQEGNYASSWGLRAAFWILTYDIVKEEPLLGVGIGDYKLAAQEALAKNDHGFSEKVIFWCSGSHYHNQYLMIVVQSGLIGFTLLVAMFVYLYRLKIDDPDIKELSILFLTIYLVAFFAEPLWVKQFPTALFVMMAGLSIAASMKTEASAADSK